MALTKITFYQAEKYGRGQHCPNSSIYMSALYEELGKSKKK